MLSGHIKLSLGSGQFMVNLPWDEKGETSLPWGLAKRGRSACFHQSSERLLRFVYSNAPNSTPWAGGGQRVALHPSRRETEHLQHSGSSISLACPAARYLWHYVGLDANSPPLLGLSCTILYPPEMEIHIEDLGRKGPLCTYIYP